MANPPFYEELPFPPLSHYFFSIFLLTLQPEITAEDTPFGASIVKCLTFQMKSGVEKCLDHTISCGHTT